MPIGHHNRPQEPLQVFAMALALALAAFLGGAAGIIWNWLSGDEIAEIEAADASIEGQ